MESLLQMEQRKSNYWLVWNQDCKLKNSVSDEGQEIGWGKKYRIPPPPWSWPNWNRRISFGGRLLVLQGFQGSPLTSDTGYDWLCWQWRNEWRWGCWSLSDKRWKKTTFRRVFKFWGRRCWCRRDYLSGFNFHQSGKLMTNFCKSFKIKSLGSIFEQNSHLCLGFPFPETKAASVLMHIAIYCKSQISISDFNSLKDWPGQARSGNIDNISLFAPRDQY